LLDVIEGDYAGGIGPHAGGIGPHADGSKELTILQAHAALAWALL
jgi:hypothetical protein